MRTGAARIAAACVRAGAVSAILAAPARAQVYVAEEDDFSNSAFVRTSPELEADLFTGDLKAREGDTAAAIAAYQRILDRGDEAVVEFGPRTYLSGIEAARRRLLALPEAARARYRELFEDRAGAARQRALLRHDAALLLDVAARWPLTDAAARALADASILAHERGDALGVAVALEKLLHSGRAAPADVVRGAAAHAAAGDASAFHALLARVAARADEEVAVGGETRRLGDVLDELAATLPGAGAHAVAPELERGPLAADLIQRLPLHERLMAPRDDLDPRGLEPVSYPVVGAARADGLEWVAGASAIYGLRVADRALTLLADYSRDLGRTDDASFVTSRTLQPLVDGGRVYLAVADARPRFTGEAEEVGRLAAFDGARGGAPLWAVTTDDPELPEELRGQVFEGPPALHGGLLLVSASRLGANTECSLFAFDRATGALRWSRFLASADHVEAYAKRNQPSSAVRVPPSPVTVADGVAYCSTNLGIIAAVDALTGSARWLFRYNRITPDDPETFRRKAFFDTGGWRRAATPMPALLGERLIVTPEDSRFLYVLALEPSPEGHLRLDDPSFKRDRQALLAVDEAAGSLVFAVLEAMGPRRDSLRIEAAGLDGATLWRSPPFAIEEHLAGRPLLLGRTLVVPTTKSVYRLALDQEGLVLDELPPPEALQRAGEAGVFGNLFRREGAILSVSPGHVTMLVPRR